MKKFIYILFIAPLFVFSQIPQGINYQAVAYDANGFELANQEISIRLGILLEAADAESSYSETHQITTNNFGLFSLVISQGNSIDNFSSLNWENGAFLKVEIDENLDGAYQLMGVNSFSSVPYALYAESSGTPGPEGPVGEPGNHGLNCWDVNSNGLNDIEEDINSDGEYNALDCMWVLSNSSSSPLGVILPYAASTAPGGWMICDGTELSRDEYSDLFSLIDTTYGSGNGSTTFNIPNLSGRVPVGKDIDGTIISNGTDIGSTGGEENHTLTVDEIPSHNHSTIQSYNSPPNGGATATGAQTYGTNYTNPFTGNEGGDQPHNNMQPYLVTNYIIRVAGEVNLNIDGVSQIPPVEQILQLQYKVDSLEDILLSVNNEVYQVYNIENMNDTINISLKRDKPINLSGSFSLGNPVYQCQCNLEITDLNNVTISSEIIKGFGVKSYSNQYQNYTSIMHTPFATQGSGLYNNSSSFSFQFEVSENLDVKIYISSTCDTYSSNITVKH